MHLNVSFHAFTPADFRVNKKFSFPLAISRNPKLVLCVQFVDCPTQFDFYLGCNPRMYPFITCFSIIYLTHKSNACILIMFIECTAMYRFNSVNQAIKSNPCIVRASHFHINRFSTQSASVRLSK